MQEWLECQNTEEMKHPQYSQNLVSCEFWLFPSLKYELRGWNFESDAQVIQETNMIFGHIPKEEFETTIKKLVERMEACLAAMDGRSKRKILNVRPWKLRMMRVNKFVFICFFFSFFFFFFLRNTHSCYHKNSYNFQSIWCTDVYGNDFDF